MSEKTSLWQRLGNPLDWRATHKNLFVLGIVWVLLFGHILWAGIVLSWPVGPELVREQHVAPHLSWLLALLGITTLLLGAAWLSGRSNADSLWHEHLAAQWYGLTLIILAHYIGIFSMATGIVFSGAPVVGFMFLRHAAVFGAIGTTIIAHAALATGALTGVLPDGNMLGPVRNPDGSLSAFWVGSIYAFSVPQYLVVVALSWYILTRWRQREAEVRLLSMTDALTGVANRRAIMALLRRELGKSRKTGLPVSVVMADLDHFKHLNDTRGHQAGDDVLVAAATALKKALRQSDHVGRYGGEEFLILLSGADTHGASLLAERCREALDALRVDIGEDEPLSVTASFGLCSNDRNAQLSEEDILRAADEALYRAKDKGRNRVEISRQE